MHALVPRNYQKFLQQEWLKSCIILYDLDSVGCRSFSTKVCYVGLRLHRISLMCIENHCNSNSVLLVTVITSMWISPAMTCYKIHNSIITADLIVTVAIVKHHMPFAAVVTRISLMVLGTHHLKTRLWIMLYGFVHSHFHSNQFNWVRLRTKWDYIIIMFKPADDVPRYCSMSLW